MGVWGGRDGGGTSCRLGSALTGTLGSGGHRAVGGPRWIRLAPSPSPGPKALACCCPTLLAIPKPTAAWMPTPAVWMPDLLAGGIEEGSITLDPCMRYVDEWVTVTEQEIAEALLNLYSHHGQLVEGKSLGGASCSRSVGRSLWGGSK